MITYSAAAFVLAYLRTVEAQATICLATYGGVATSVPPPGRDFIIQASPYLSPLDPGDPSLGFLDSSGHLQSICQNSSTFVLSSGLLYSGGDQVSVAPGVSSMRFGASEFAQAIDNTFAVDEANGRMVWNNNAFSDGTARFCADPAGALYAVFSGPLPANCTAAELRVQNPASCVRLSMPSLVLPTLLGNQTSLVVPTPSLIGALRPPYLQPQLQPAPAIFSPDPNTSSVASSPIYATSSSLVDPSSTLSDPSTSLSSSSSTLSILSSSLSSSSGAASVLPSSSSSIYAISSLPVTFNTSTAPSITSTTNTLESPSSTLVSSSGTAVVLVNPVAQASSIIHQDRLTVWCTDVLGYTVPPQFTVTILSNVSATTLITTRPTNDTTTNPVTLTSTSTEDIPSFNITIIRTPTITSTVTTTDDFIVVATTTVVGPSLGARKRGLPYMPGKPHFIDPQQPRLEGASSNTTSVISNTTFASSGTLPASVRVSSANNSPKLASNPVSIAGKYAPPVSSNGASVKSNATAGLNATASLNATAAFNATSAMSNATGLRTITTPVVLQTFNPSIISAACSQNANMPPPLPNITTSITTTFTYIDYVKQPYTTVNTTYIIPVDTTINNGNHTTTITATPETNDITDITTATSTLTSTVVTFPSNVPTLILTSAVPLGPFSSGGALPPDIDDAAYELTLPFPMRMFDHSSDVVWVSTNGILSLDNGTREYDNECLPSIGNEDYPHDPVPPYSAFPFWDDTYIYAGQPQGIYYQYGNGSTNNITYSPENSPATNVTFEYYLSHCCGNGDGGNLEYYHYTVYYDSLLPGIFTFRYYQISENGTSATVGIQDFVADTAITYSCNEPIVTPGLEVVVNTIIGTVRQSNFM